MKETSLVSKELEVWKPEGNFEFIDYGALLKFLFRKTLKRSSVPRYLHSAVLLSGVMLVFGGNSHNGTVQLQSGLPCFSMDFLAYDTGKLCQVYLQDKRTLICNI